MARSSRKTAASKGGGHIARPLGVAAKIVLTLCIAAALVYAFREAGAPELVEQLQASAGEQEAAEEDGRRIDWDSLPDSIVAWIEIPGTNVDAPVAQGLESSPDHFLYNDALGQGAYGTPYIDWECAPDSRYVAVYGHHMDDGSQFADVAKFSDPDYAEEHQVIYWYTRIDNRCHELKVVAVDVLNASYETQRTSFKDDSDRISYLEDKISLSDYVLGDADLASSRIVSLATCSYQTWNSRTVVYATDKDG